MSKYDDLVNQLKAEQNKLYLIPEDLPEKVKTIFMEMKRTLADLELTDADVVSELLSAKIGETLGEDLQFTVISGLPTPGMSSAPGDLIAVVTMGQEEVLPKKAFNVKAYWKDGHLKIHYSPVPANGNLRR